MPLLIHSLLLSPYHFGSHSMSSQSNALIASTVTLQTVLASLSHLRNDIDKVVLEMDQNVRE